MELTSSKNKSRKPLSDNGETKCGRAVVVAVILSVPLNKVQPDCFHSTVGILQNFSKHLSAQRVHDLIPNGKTPSRAVFHSELSEWEEGCLAKKTAAMTDRPSPSLQNGQVQASRRLRRPWGGGLMSSSSMAVLSSRLSPPVCRECSPVGTEQRLCEKLRHSEKKKKTLNRTKSCLFFLLRVLKDPPRKVGAFKGAVIISKCRNEH